jgi:ATP-dependent DNA helicase RecG
MSKVTDDFLNALRRMPAETEWLEFKRAEHTFSYEHMGQYVSALANEANLEQRDEGWLVMGIENKINPTRGLRPATGTDFARTLDEINRVKESVAAQTSPSVALPAPDVIHVPGPDGAPVRVLIWRVPAAPRGVPVACKGHFWGRAGERLVGLPLHKLDALRAQSTLRDWSSTVVSDDWTLLSTAAIARARELYARRHAPRSDIVSEMRSQTDAEFLHGLRLAVNGGLTRAALVLLGQPVATSFLGGPTPRISWQLVDHRGDHMTHQHFDLPLLLAIDALIARIRIIEVNVLPPREVAPLNLPNYDDWVMREALHNCVAHQDYGQGGRVLVTESPDTLRFFNYGEFLPGSLDRVLKASQPEQRYRNACLANAMVELDLMETTNRGVKGMFRKQRERFFPLPDFEIDVHPASVSVTIHGRTLDERYVSALMTHTDLSLEEAVLLDQVQKGRLPPASQLQRLRAKGLIEGRGQKVRISAAVAVALGSEVAYVNQKGPVAQDYKDVVCRLLAMAPQPRAKIDELLLPKLMMWIPGATERKKYIKELLSDMARQGTIRNIGKPTRGAVWTLAAPMKSKIST